MHVIYYTRTLVRRLATPAANVLDRRQNLRQMICGKLKGFRTEHTVQMA